MLIAAGATGALTLIEPRDLGPWQRAAYRLAVSAGSGLMMADVAADDQPLMDPARDGLVAGGMTLGLMDLTEHVDGRIVEALHGVGVHKPRPLMAVLNAGAAALLYAVPPSGGDWAPFDDAFEESEPQDLPVEVRELIAMLLEPSEDGTEIPGAGTLRDQLATARTYDPGYATCDVQLLVEDPERLVVPHQQTWPVTGRFERGGLGHRLELMIGEGRLAMLTVMVEDDEESGVDPDAFEAALEALASPDFRFPRPAEVTVHRESEQVA